ncbi:ABC transporter permease [Demequina sp. NBRC 110057]|uniref:ABC transporter permease n=1 Tax=Demequina sp. NBRC 110057 TaxID=1570346 RepID=UPI0009FCE583|nr:ABC transporter permease [Demequina sp. NBRC 110057]
MTRLRNGALIAGVSLIVFLLAFAFIGPLLTPYGVNDVSDVTFAPPTSEHWLGTDNLGRDMFVRLAIATRYAILISFASTVLAMVAGTGIGLIAGYAGGRLDNLLMRSTEVVMAIPAILLALVVRVIFGPGFLPLILAMAIIGAPGFARIMRSPILVLKERDFVVAAEIAGVRRPRIALSHLLPNATTPMLVNFASTASLAVLIESSLSYLGQGVQPPDPSAGRMISEFQRFMYEHPTLVVMPAVVITLLTVAWNLLADGVQVALTPKAGNLAVPTRRRRRGPRPASPRANAVEAAPAEPEVDPHDTPDSTHDAVPTGASSAPMAPQGRA